MNYSKLKTFLPASKYLLIFVLFGYPFFLSCKYQYKPMNIVSENKMVHDFYANNSNQFWFASNKNMKKANEWLDVLDSANKFGLISDKVQIEQARTALENNKTGIELKEATDQQITGLVLNFIKQLQEGNVHFDFDEVRIPRDSVYASQLLNSKHSESVSDMIARLDCKDPDYLVCKKFLNDSLTVNDTLKFKTISLAMNYRRYLTLNEHSDYIIANIPETKVRYYRNKQLALEMKSVVGKKKNPTPTIASYITDIVTFPFWNVPFSIASKELLPKVQKDESYLERNNFEVVDGKGNVVDDSDLNWENYTEKNFPYFFRESTGPNNSLGVLKFNLQNPFSIYLHDTNSKGAFAKDNRFLSHGCVRLEKPLELAELLAEDKIDVKAIKSGKANTESKTIKLDQKIPVFIIYMPVIIEGEKVTFIEDIYGLVK
ncbi:MAG: ErfK/YbiS/YcfS/YnhG family [Prolixibacteraceae bacterium]|nr:MAG: ErfK/YbiS/YcfS/YnhG family [Prolixibacteraceae bacterium]